MALALRRAGGAGWAEGSTEGGSVRSAGDDCGYGGGDIGERSDGGGRGTCAGASGAES